MAGKNRFWLSFADDTGFLGVIVTEAEDIRAAAARTWALGINPGGEIAAWEHTPEILAGMVPEERTAFLAIPLDVLLSKEVLQAMAHVGAKSIREFFEEEQ